MNQPETIVSSFYRYLEQQDSYYYWSYYILEDFTDV